MSPGRSEKRPATKPSSEFPRQACRSAIDSGGMVVERPDPATARRRARIDVAGQSLILSTIACRPVLLWGTPDAACAIDVAERRALWIGRRLPGFVACRPGDRACRLAGWPGRSGIGVGPDRRDPAVFGGLGAGNLYQLLYIPPQAGAASRRDVGTGRPPLGPPRRAQRH